MITSMWAISLIPAPIAQTIFSLVPVLVMVLGAVFFKLPLKRNLIAGCVIAILGVLVLIWRQQIIDYCLWMFA
jgi:drug/metabolite transporter (DMT)-like permease